jgi:DNA-binding GntR family transcriptional regulator
VLTKASYVPFGEEAYDVIKKMILKGDLKPGERLIESHLSRRLGISRTPIRESIQRLTADGLVEMWPKGGARVSELRAKDIEEIYEIRDVMESFAAEKATRLLTDKEIEALKKLAHEGEVALDKRDISKMARINTRFHRIICKASRNERLLKLTDVLQTNITRYRELILEGPVAAGAAMEGHREIADAMAKRDQRAVKRAMHKHISRVKQTLLRKLQK